MFTTSVCVLLISSSAPQLFCFTQDVLLRCGLRGKHFTAAQISHIMMPIHTAISFQMSALLILVLFMQLTLFLCKVSIRWAFHESGYADWIWQLRKHG